MRRGYMYHASREHRVQLCRLALSSSVLARGMAIKVGDAFPTGPSVQIAFKENHKIEDLVGKGNVLVVSLPGAFTPT